MSETCPSSFKGTRCNNPGVLGSMIAPHTSPSATERYRTSILEDVDIVRANLAAHATTGSPNHWHVKITADVAAAIPTQSGIISSHRMIACRSSGTPARPMMRSAPQTTVRAADARARAAFHSMRRPCRTPAPPSSKGHKPQTKSAQYSMPNNTHSRWLAMVSAGPCPGRGDGTAPLRVPRAAPRRRERSSHTPPTPRAGRDAPHRPAR